ncbi:Chloride channel protein 1 [Aphelenchoides fujianensis]|nr:Chloride channel protein 1 [Aphelenchoides fujianensis]
MTHRAVGTEYLKPPPHAHGLITIPRKNHYRTPKSRSSRHGKNGSQHDKLLHGDSEEDEVGVYNESFRDFLRRHWYNLVHFFVEDWFLSAMLGFITAALSITVDVSYEYLNHYRAHLYDHAAQYDTIVGFTVWILYLVGFVSVSALICRYLSVQAIGSGIPELKVIMHGFMLNNYLTFRTLVAKVFALTLALGSGLPVGKEGPFVHMSAIVATLLSKVTRKFQDSVFFSNEGKENQILSSGCAVGIACTFSAPAGAVLYGIESTHKYFAVKSYWRSFFATTCSALIFRMANAFIIPPHIAGTITAYYQSNFPNEVFVIEEIPLFVFVGLLSGFFGACFICLHRRIAYYQKRNRLFKAIFGRSGLSFTIFMAFVVGLITFPDGFGKYVAGKYTFRETLSDLISNCTMMASNLTDRGCSEAIINRWTADGETAILPTMLGYFVMNYILVAVCITLAVPAGIFVPSFVLGATGGRLIGEILVLIFPDGLRGIDGPQIYPGLYAVVGAAAYTGAITHSLSIAVIVCETTGQLCALLPVLIALMVANAVSSFLTPSIYESIIQIKNYPHLAELPPSRISVHKLKVEQFMVTDVTYITKQTTYKALRELLISTPHLRSYPLVTDDEERLLLGSVARKYLNYLVTIHLGAELGVRGRTRSGHGSEIFGSRRGSTGAALLEHTISGNTLLSSSPLHDATTHAPIPWLMPKRSLANAVDGSPAVVSNNSLLMDRARKLETPLDLDELAVDSAPFQLVLGTSLYKVHTLFSLLGLNHAYVTHRGRLVGVVALRELRFAMHDIYTRGAVPCPTASTQHLHLSGKTDEKSPQTTEELTPLEVLGGKPNGAAKLSMVDELAQHGEPSPSGSSESDGGISIHIDTSVMPNSETEEEKSPP